MEGFGGGKRMLPPTLFGIEHGLSVAEIIKYFSEININKVFICVTGNKIKFCHVVVSSYDFRCNNELESKTPDTGMSNL